MDFLNSIPNLRIYFTYYLTIYLTGYFIIFRNWTSATRPEATSCLISLFHGTPAVYLSISAILSSATSSFSSPNTAAQSSALDFSISYFLSDLAHLLLFSPRDFLYIGHHLATLFVLSSCRLLAYGGTAVLTLLAIAEVTSFCQNVWSLSGARKGDVVVAKRVYETMSPAFYLFYTVVRGFVGPWFVLKMVMSFVRDGVISKWVWVSWVCVVVMALSVSWLWVSNLWLQLYRERYQNFYKKLR